MFHRLITITFEPERLGEILQYMDDVKEGYLKTEGLVSNRLIQVDAGTVVAVVIYASQAASEASAEAASRILSGLAPMIAGSPTIHEGDPVWQGVA